MIELTSLTVFDNTNMIQFWSAALFTVYHASTMIVLLNMLIAMMANSYQQIEVSYCCKNQTGVDLASSARRGAGFPWGGACGSITAHSPLQSAILLSQHYHYFRWLNLHVRCYVLHYLKFMFTSAFFSVTGQLLYCGLAQYSIFENMAV
jgi:hypothetical protein